MFVRKITKITHVGKFKKAAIRGGEYKKYTLVYGGNGRGKTTLCAILRSLQQNDASHITKRRTFKVTTPQEVQLLLDSGKVTFDGIKWAAHHPDIHIFDQHFILENIHTGDEVGIDQRRNFYRIIVGPAGVALATEIDALDAKAMAAQTAINAEKKVLAQHVPKGMALETWLAIKADPDIAAKIVTAAAAVTAAENSSEIATRALLVPIPVPALPPGFAATLAKGLPELAAEAAAKVSAQMAKHGFHDDGEAWLSSGLARIVEDDCPFCGASVAGNALIEAYQGYFSEAYAAHLAAIQTALAELTSAVGSAVTLKVTQGISKARGDAEFWLRYTPHAVVVLPELDGAGAALTKLYQAAKAQMDLKVAKPLETPLRSSALDDALTSWGIITGSILAVNTAMFAGNILIQAVKKSSATSTLVSAQAALASLVVIENRHSSAVIPLTMSYWNQLSIKMTATEDKDKKKTELDAYDAKVLGGYEADINTYLTTFNAPFKLVKCSKSYQGRLPQSAYCLQFDGHDVDVTANAQSNDPTFYTTLSAGDKSTFALAFFLAQLKRDPDIARKVVVFDDPFTSLDDFRREITAKAIYRVANDGGFSASQVIVFSHDKYFLDSLRKNIHATDEWAALQVSITKGSATIEEWLIEREVKEGYLKEHMALCDYAQGQSGDAASMRTRMRPLLEQYIRYRFPNQIEDDHWLGAMLDVIRTTPDHPLKAIYRDLEDINDYTKVFHHEPSASFDDQEVLAHVKRTLVIVGGWAS